MNKPRLNSDGPIFLWIVVNRGGSPLRSACGSTRKDAIVSFEQLTGESWRVAYRKYGYRVVKMLGRVLPRYGGHYDFMAAHQEPTP